MKCPKCNSERAIGSGSISNTESRDGLHCPDCGYSYEHVEKINNFNKPNPPKAGTTPSPKSQTPTYTPPPMPEVKPAKVDMTPLKVSRETFNRLRDKGLLNPNIAYEIKEEQHTVLSVRDFAILYNIANNKIMQMESQAQTIYYFEHDDSERVEKERAENMERLHQRLDYQDLLRIREKLGELNIEIETPSVEVEE